ncbi:hypothetical protein [Brachybacterium sp. J153]|uniref:hypothetical protein n=1 Tax=Brachybacterium sp. J153 TaxID=3116488 RepID=UPI002E768572|nr:hypothetical protein [Brachybacterium sp. J153]MEE1618108.1 hypothetical protein [Brachybacterium sp. J153]
MSVTLEKSSAVLLAVAVACGSLAVGIGAFLGGYALGDEPEPVAPTALAEKTYTVADLEAALAACELDGAEVVDSSVSLLGGDWPAYKRQYFVAEMDAPEIADRDYTTHSVDPGPAGRTTPGRTCACPGSRPTRAGT